MKKFLINFILFGIFVLIKSSNDCGTRYRSTQVLFGGSDIRFGDWPWFGRLFNNNGGFFCGATLISEKHLLTAAHCIREINSDIIRSPSSFHVMLGGLDIGNLSNPAWVRKNVKTVHIHPDYGKNWGRGISEFDADIAIIEINSSVRFSSYVRKICLSSPESVAENRTGKVVGHGLNEARNLENIAKFIEISTIDLLTCIFKHQSFISSTSFRTFCAGGNGKVACGGDSGGGFYVLEDHKWKILGIVSSAILDEYDHCDSNLPTVFTNVLKFSDWIKEISGVTGEVKAEKKDCETINECGNPARIVDVLSIDGSVKLKVNLEIIDEIFLHPEVKDRKIVVLSIVGAYGGGKSFFLNYCLRYLYATYESSNSEFNKGSTQNNWIGDENEPLTGFSWIHGSTKGFMIWSDVFLYDAQNGEKVAIFIMDTQGLFDLTISDLRSPAEENAIIFLLTTLVSSIQIINLRERLQEVQISYLQTAIDLAKLVKNHQERAHWKPLQNLVYLFRDSFDDDFDFGFAGGESYCESFFETTSKPFSSILNLINMKSSFDKFSCFLLPYPGRNVTRKNFKGQWSVLHPDFIEQLKTLIESLLSPEKLAKKSILGKELTATEFRNLFVKYTEAFSAPEMPSVERLYQIMSEN